MPQSLSQLYVHLIFSTKDRFPFLKDDVAFRVHGYLATVVRDMGSPFVVVGGIDDHVHILFDMGRIHAAKDFVEQIKRESSKIVESLRPNLDKFYWQRGYGIFSVSPTHRESVVQYIKNQGSGNENPTNPRTFSKLLESLARLTRRVPKMAKTLLSTWMSCCELGWNALAS